MKRPVFWHIAAIVLGMIAGVQGLRAGAPVLFCALTLAAVHAVYSALYSPATARVWSIRTLLALPALAVLLWPVVFVMKLDAAAFAWLLAPLAALGWFHRRSERSRRLRIWQAVPMLAGACGWTFTAPWVVGGSPEEQLFAAGLIAVAAVKVLAGRCPWPMGLLLGLTAGAATIGVAMRSWAQFYGAGVPVVWGLSPSELSAMAVACGAFSGLLAAMERRRVDVTQTELGPKARNIAPEVAQMLADRHALAIDDSAPAAPTAELDERKSLPPLLAALRKKDLNVVYSAAEAIGQLGPAAGQAAPQLVPLVGRDPLPGDRAAESLSLLGPAGGQALIELLTAGDEHSRAAAAHALRRCAAHTPRTAEVLIRALADTAGDVRRQAAASLGELDPPAHDAAAALEERLNDRELMVRLAARKALARLATRASGGVVTGECSPPSSQP